MGPFRLAEGEVSGDAFSTLLTQLENPENPALSSARHHRRRFTPFIAVAGLVSLRRSSRLPAEMLLGSLVTAVTLSWIKPLVRADVLSMTVDSDSGQAALVGTGLFPITARAPGATPVVLEPGQRGVLRGVQIPHGGEFRVHITPHLTPTLWVGLACCWLLPLIVLMVVGIGPRERAAAHWTLV